MARKLRIAVSVFFGLLTVALCVMWVRSFWRADYISWHNNGIVTFCSDNGYLTLSSMKFSSFGIPVAIRKHWTVNSVEASGRIPHRLYRSDAMSTFIAAPYLYLALVIGAVAALPFVSFRFSLSILLLGLTLVCVLLAVAVLIAG